MPFDLLEALLDMLMFLSMCIGAAVMLLYGSAALMSQIAKALWRRQGGRPVEPEEVDGHTALCRRHAWSYGLMFRQMQIDRISGHWVAHLAAEYPADNPAGCAYGSTPSDAVRLWLEQCGGSWEVR